MFKTVSYKYGVNIMKMKEKESLTEFYKRKKAYNFQIFIFSYTLYM